MIVDIYMIVVPAYRNVVDSVDWRLVGGRLVEPGPLGQMRDMKK